MERNSAVAPTTRNIRSTAKTTIFACLSLTLLPQVASALSCLPPDFRESFRGADASSQSYLVVEGEFTLAVSELVIAKGEDGMPMPYTSVEGAIDGRSLGSKDRTTPFNRSVTFEIECIRNSCGLLLPNTKMIAFVRKENDRYFVEAPACGGLIFYEPSKEDKTTVQQCLNGGNC